MHYAQPNWPACKHLICEKNMRLARNWAIKSKMDHLKQLKMGFGRKWDEDGGLQAGLKDPLAR